MSHKLKYLSVCSGIEAATVAWHPLGWEAVGYSEIDPFTSALLKFHYTTKNYGDLTKHESWDIKPGTVNLLCGGTPCQSYSQAGNRTGLDDPRGRLMLSFLELAERLKPRWIVWENVPGVLSSGKPKGSDFGCFIQGLVKCGYGVAWRVLDAQYVGGAGAVPQRRRRVFVVACLGNWKAATEVLSFKEGVQWNRTSRGRKGKDSSTCTEEGVDRHDQSSGSVIYENHPNDSRVTGPHKISPTVTSRFGTGGGNVPFVIDGSRVRKLTVVETERLQGFPDNYTQIPWRGKPADKCPDNHRYKACGNSMAVPCMRFIGEQIALVDSQISQ